MNIDHASLLEIANHAIGTAARELSQLLGVEMKLGDPSTLDHEPDKGVVDGALVLVEVSFTEGIEGETTFAFTREVATQMLELMVTGTGHAEEDILGAHGTSILGEAMNRFMAGIGRALGEHIGRPVNFLPPVMENVADGVQTLAKRPSDVVVAWECTIGPTAGRLYWTMTTDAARALVPEEGAAGRPTGPPSSQAGAAASASGPGDLGRLADVVLDVTVELGRSRLTIKELLALDEGGVIRLGRQVGEPVDLLVNGLTTARGEIVVVDGRLGLRVTELVG